MTLVGYWPLDEDSGTTATDYAGSNDGTASGAGPSGTGTLAGPLGATAYDFDASDDYVNMGDVLSLPNEITVAAWIRPEQNSNYATIVSKRDVGSSTEYQFRHDSNLQFIGGDGSFTTLTGNTSLSTNTWYHAAATRRSNDDATLYLNGVADGSKSVPGSSSSARMAIGQFDGTNGYDGGEAFEGAISGVHVYDHALSPNEIYYLYQVGAGQARAVSEVKTA